MDSPSSYFREVCLVSNSTGDTYPGEKCRRVTLKYPTYSDSSRLASAASAYPVSSSSVLSVPKHDSMNALS